MILKKFKKEKDMTELAVQKKTLTPEQKKKRKNGSSPVWQSLLLWDLQ